MLAWGVLCAHRVWDLQTGQLKRSSSGIGTYINGVALTPSGTTGISVSWDDSIRWVHIFYVCKMCCVKLPRFVWDSAV